MSRELALIENIPAAVLSAIEEITSPIVSAVDGQFDGVAVTGIKLARNVPEEALRQALNAVQQSLRPSGPAGAAKAMMRLKATARVKDRGQEDQAGEAIVMAEKLAQYPADIIAQVAEKQIETSPWWPHVSELMASCERLTVPRRKLLDALKAALEPAKPALFLGKPAPETRADRLRNSINAFLRHGRPLDAARVERTLVSE